MKRFISIWAAIAMIFSFYACDGDKNYTPRNSDTEINRPDDNEGDSDDTGDTGDSGDTEGTIDRSQYMQYNHTLTKGQAGYYGVYYEDQPTTTANWYLELADNNYDFETYEGNGFNTVLEFFSSNPSSTSILSGSIQSRHLTAILSQQVRFFMDTLASMMRTERQLSTLRAHGSLKGMMQ